MTTLSYSSMNSLIKEPHTWLCRQMGLKTFTTDYFEKGKAAHRVIQEHVCGVKTHPLLNDLPEFSLVETCDFDEKMRVTMPINDEYEFTGFIDGINPDKKEILEIKTGGVWSTSKFAQLVQWKLYALAGNYTRAWCVNVPFNSDTWKPNNVKIISANVTDTHKLQAKAFIDAALSVLESYDDYVKDFKKAPRSRFCFYENCPYCLD